jgi:DNA topoisomerase-1
VKQGKVNASLPEGTTADTITLEQAVELLAAKAPSGKGAGRARPTRATAPKASGAKTPKTPKPASKASGSTKPAKPATKPPVTTKTGRLRASAVRVIKPAGS